MMDQPPAILLLMQDTGGTLGERKAVVEWLKRSGIQVHIKGSCASSCALLFGLPKEQICVYPQAWLGYHTAPGQSQDRVVWKRGIDEIAKGVRACQ